MNISNIVLILLIYTSIVNTWLLWDYLYEKYFYRWEFDWHGSPFREEGDKWKLKLVIYDKDMLCGTVYDLKLTKKRK